MRLKQSITICADAAVVWPLIADPVRQADWNDKIVSIDRDRSGPACLGESYEMIYELAGRQRLSRVRVTVCEPPHRVSFLHSTNENSVERSAEEVYEIRPTRDGVQVVQSNIARMHIPWLLRPLIWFVHRFGWRVGPQPLERLKQLAEETAHRR